MLTIINRFRSRSSSSSPIGHLTTNVDSLTYNMKHRSRGKCLIFNNRCFDIHTRLNERRGTEIDAKALYGVFRDLEFDVNVYNDASAKDIVALLELGIHIHITYNFVDFFYINPNFCFANSKFYALKTY